MRTRRAPPRRTPSPSASCAAKTTPPPGPPSSAPRRSTTRTSMSSPTRSSSPPASRRRRKTRRAKQKRRDGGNEPDRDRAAKRSAPASRRPRPRAPGDSFAGLIGQRVPPQGNSLRNIQKRTTKHPPEEPSSSGGCFVIPISFLHQTVCAPSACASSSMVFGTRASSGKSPADSAPQRAARTPIS